MHPRRTYYYLSTCPHQPLPEPVSPSQKPPRMHVQPRRPIVSPAMSVAGSQSAAPSSAPSSIDETDSTEDSRRRELSPSPEIDLSSPELDDMDDDFYMPGTPMGGSGILDHPHHRLPHILGAGALSAAHGASRSVSAGSNAAAVAASHRRRGPSPPLEKDEREFTQTADGLQQRRRMTGGSLLAATPMSPTRAGADQQLPSLQMDERMDLDVEDIFAGDDESKTPSAASRSTLVVTMAGQRNPSSPTAAVLLSSPAILPLIAPPLLKMGSPGGSVNGDGGWAKLDAMLEWDRSPEDVELEELDCLLDEY